jgi:hypothetical protein
MSFIFTLRFVLIQLHKYFYHSCRSLTNWRLGTFLEHGLRGLVKSFGALLALSLAVH